MATYPSSSKLTRAKHLSRSSVDELQGASESMTEAEAQAVKTFSFDVSAGHKPKENTQTYTPRADKPASPEASAPKNTEQEKKPRTAVALKPVSCISTKRTTKAKSKKRRVSPFSTSIVMHVIFLFCLGVTTFGLPPLENDLEIVTAQPVSEEFEEFQDLEIDPTESLESLETELISDIEDINEVSLMDLSAESAFGELADDIGNEGEAFGDFGNLLTDVGGLSKLGEDISGAGAVTFFGTQVEGRRILFMLDNSGSMHSGPMEQLVDELIKTVDSLAPQQEFFVIFYSDIVYPLGFPQPAQDFVSANQENKLRLTEWLSTVELCGGNAVDQAILTAEKLKPDVVFMLSDGDVRTTPSGRKYNLLMRNSGRNFKLHTLGMGCETEEHRNQLRAIAEAHGSTFREVAVDPMMAARAHSNPRPYRNRSNPGQTWGRSFGK